MPILTVEKRDTTLLITLNRPKERNALNAELIELMRATLTDYHDNQSIRAVILQGAGEHFCAGADIKHMHSLQTATHQENLNDATQLAELLWQLDTFPTPVIALSQGAAIGGGVGLLAACDIVCASRDAIFSFSEVKLGLIPAIISPYVLRAIGNRAMRRYFLTAERMSSDTACQLGLIHEVVTADTLIETGMALADNIAQNGPHAVIAAKKLIADINNQSLNHASALSMAERLATIRSTNEAREGFRAFTEKRLPNWS